MGINKTNPTNPQPALEGVGPRMPRRRPWSRTCPPVIPPKSPRRPRNQGLLPSENNFPGGLRRRPREGESFLSFGGEVLSERRLIFGGAKTKKRRFPKHSTLRMRNVYLMKANQKVLAKGEAKAVPSLKLT